MQHVRIFFVTFALTSTLLAQQPAPGSLPTGGSNVAVVATQIDQAAQSTNLDLAKLRIDKWKADGGVKREAQQNTDSLERNLTAALPELIGQVRRAPNDVVTLFRLYRNVGALYDVLSNVAETTGAFGSKSEYQTLAEDVQRFDQARRTLGDAVEQAAQRQSAQLLALRNTTSAQSSAPPPPKRIIVDNAEPAAKKKRTAKAKKSTTPATSGSPQPAPQ